jgi:hypothetical protein
VTHSHGNPTPSVSPCVRPCTASPRRAYSYTTPADSKTVITTPPEKSHRCTTNIELAGNRIQITTPLPGLFRCCSTPSPEPSANTMFGENPDDSGQEIDPETGKPIERIYQENPKHGPVAGVDAHGRPRSKAPQDGQGALDSSQPVPGKERQRVGTDSNRDQVELRRTLQQVFEDRILEIWHGFVLGSGK